MGLLWEVNKYSISMGQGYSKFQKSNKIRRGDWETIYIDRGVEMVRDRGNREGQIRTFKLTSEQDIAKELEHFHRRKNTDSCLIKCFGAEVSPNQHITIILERIVLRWPELPQLTFPETIFALRQALTGFRTLFNEAGGFDISEEMMAVNYAGKVKVWFNEDYLCNEASCKKEEITIANTAEDRERGRPYQKMMVKSVVDLVEEKCEEGRYPPNFRDSLHNHVKSFDSCLRRIRGYLEDVTLLLPEHIHTDPHKMFEVRNVSMGDFRNELMGSCDIGPHCKRSKGKWNEISQQTNTTSSSANKLNNFYPQ